MKHSKALLLFAALSLILVSCGEERSRPGWAARSSSQTELPCYKSVVPAPFSGDVSLPFCGYVQTDPLDWCLDGDTLIGGGCPDAILANIPPAIAPLVTIERHLYGPPKQDALGNWHSQHYWRIAKKGAPVKVSIVNWHGGGLTRGAADFPGGIKYFAEAAFQTGFEFFLPEYPRGWLDCNIGEVAKERTAFRGSQQEYDRVNTAGMIAAESAELFMEHMDDKYNRKLVIQEGESAGGFLALHCSLLPKSRSWGIKECVAGYTTLPLEYETIINPNMTTDVKIFLAGGEQDPLVPIEFKKMYDSVGLSTNTNCRDTVFGIKGTAQYLINNGAIVWLDMTSNSGHGWGVWVNPQLRYGEARRKIIEKETPGIYRRFEAIRLPDGSWTADTLSVSVLLPE